MRGKDISYICYILLIINVNFSLEAQIKALEARNTLVTTLGVCNKKKAWMEFEDLYIKLQELQTDLQKAEE